MHNTSFLLRYDLISFFAPSRPVSYQVTKQRSPGAVLTSTHSQTLNDAVGSAVPRICLATKSCEGRPGKINLRAPRDMG